MRFLEENSVDNLASLELVKTLFSNYISDEFSKVYPKDLNLKTKSSDEKGTGEQNLAFPFPMI